MTDTTVKFDTFLSVSPESIERMARKVASQIQAMAQVSPIAAQIMVEDLTTNSKWILPPHITRVGRE